MDSAVVSQHLLDRIRDREVVAALFTTFTFEPEFFELEVIPLLLKQSLAYSTDERVKQLMVREHLRESGLPIDVYYDLPMYRETGSASPEMEYGCHGVLHPNGAFHGKICLILMKETGGGQSLLLGAGSNNLTRAGWWDNIECLHWEELQPRGFSVKLRNILLEDLALLETHRYPSNEDLAATLLVRQYLETTRCAQSQPVHYFGLSSGLQRRPFPHYLMKKPRPIAAHDNWNLEIISPFFADDPLNDEHEIFIKNGVKTITMLLPRDEEGVALCPEAYYEAVKEAPGLQWADWTEALKKTLGLTGNHFRRLHAKVYHFYRRGEAWVFVGSVNFSHKALWDNIEAGFLLRLPKAIPLLEPLSEDTHIHRFNEPEELPPGSATDDHLSRYPVVQICYDWLSGKLSGRVGTNEGKANGKSERISIQLHGAEAETIIEPWLLQSQVRHYDGDLEALRKSLRHGSLLEISGEWRSGEDKGKNFPRHRVLVQQLNWTHKPLDIPDLTPAQILAIYAGMSSERRQLLLSSERIRQLLLRNQGGELSLVMNDNLSEQFFSEYAEIFNAFRRLRNRMQNALAEERLNELDYYLTGTGVDSLPTLLDKALTLSEERRALEDTAHSHTLSPVSAYLILLCVDELYAERAFAKRPQVGSCRARIQAVIDALENGDQIRLERHEDTQRAVFFRWFREQFCRRYRVVEQTDS